MLPPGNGAIPPARRPFVDMEIVWPHSVADFRAEA